MKSLKSHHTEVNSTGDFLFLEQNMTWRLIAASCTAALLPVTFLSKSAKYVQAEEVEQKRTKIVIVGAGLTGCLTSYLIRYVMLCIIPTVINLTWQLIFQETLW